MSFKRYIHCISITDSGVESSATNIGFESAISDNEHPPANIEDEGSPAPAPPSLEDAMQRLAETIKEFDSHAMTDQDEEKSTADEGQKTTNGEEQQKEDEAEKQPQNKQNLSQGQISIFLYLSLFFCQHCVTAKKQDTISISPKHLAGKNPTKSMLRTR